MRTLDPEHTGGEKGWILPEVQMLPLTGLGVVDWTGLGAMGTGELFPRLEIHLHIQPDGNPVIPKAAISH